MKERDPFDFWYAVNNTEVILMPKQHLETFGTTVINYHLVSELMDNVDQIRIREGRMQFSQPKIIAPDAYSQTLLEGFGEQAGKYLDWLKENKSTLHILQYGYTLKQQSFSEHVVSDNMQTVVDRVKSDVTTKSDPLAAVVVGVDSPWDVCLIKLFLQVMLTSAGTNIQQLKQRHLFDDDRGVPRGIREEIEVSFETATKHRHLINALAKKLRTYNLFEEYEDRFFSLVKNK